MLCSSFTAWPSTAGSAMPGPHASASSAKVSCAVRASVSASKSRAATPVLCPAQQLTSLMQEVRTARQRWPCSGHHRRAIAAPAGKQCHGCLGVQHVISLGLISAPWCYHLCCLLPRLRDKTCTGFAAQELTLSSTHRTAGVLTFHSNACLLSHLLADAQRSVANQDVRGR